jgi:hypothetical protein
LFRNKIIINAINIILSRYNRMAAPAPAPAPQTVVKVFGNVQRTGIQQNTRGGEDTIFKGTMDQIDLQETVSVRTAPASMSPTVMENAIVFAAIGGITPDKSSKEADCKGKDYKGADGKTYRVICPGIIVDRTRPQVYQTSDFAVPKGVDRPKIEYSGKTITKVFIPVYEVPAATGGRKRKSRRQLKSRQRGGKSRQRKGKSRRRTRRH